MATTDSNKSTANSRAGKSTKAASGNARSTRSRSSAQRASSDGRRNNGGNNSSYIPSMTATVASLVGAGIALGFGLFATRSRWMPYAGDLNDRMQDRWDEFAHRNDDNADEGTDYNSDYRAKTDNWPKDQGTAAEYPDASKVTL